MKKTNITLSIALAAVFSSSVVFAEPEVTGKIVHESGFFSEAGALIGASSTNAYSASGSTTHSKNDAFKRETSVKIYVDGDADELVEGAAYHVELNLMRDGKAISAYDSNESYTQRDALREAYVDVEQGDWSIRAGKQQVVWGTADGMKLLDNINPTDYSEMAQNQMEDSRMPVWMVNAETDIESGGSFQVIASEGKGHKIAGLGNSAAKGTTHTNSNSGQAFVMKGVDTLTGKVNGFLDIAPALGKVAYSFSNDAGGAGTQLSGAYGYTVQGFTDNNAGNFKYFCTGAVADADCLAGIANGTGNPTNPIPFGFAANTGGQDANAHTLIDAETGVGTWDTDNPNSMFEYMPSATFATFDTFVSMTSEYRTEEASGGNLGFKYKNTTDNGVNYSLNFLNHVDPNPYVGLHYEKQDGTRLYERSGAGNLNVYKNSVYLCETDADCSANVVGGAAGVVTGVDANVTNKAANLVMTEKHARINSIGGSFDMAIETEGLGPVVLRGEVLYDKDTMQPIITRKEAINRDLEHGFFIHAFQNKKTDFLKYVLGADITVLTNMMISAQFIQIKNLDFIDVGDKNAVNWQYSGDTAAMHLSNNLQKGIENKNFYSLFFSKPFGASGEHRWNNIIMLEKGLNGNGKWNRLDAEFSIDDDTQATVEWNKYFGDENTQFGQFAKSSNIQVGVKYSF
jgi:hypothetical protein